MKTVRIVNTKTNELLAEYKISIEWVGSSTTEQEYFDKAWSNLVNDDLPSNVDRSDCNFQFIL